MVARRAHNPKVVGSNPAPATTNIKHSRCTRPGLFTKIRASSIELARFVLRGLGMAQFQ